jgi:ribonuclease P protein component
MLPRPLRLTRQEDILRVLRTGRVVKNPYLRLHFQVLPEQPFPRFACVVGKKVHRHAVKRHRYQRWLRHLVRQHAPTSFTGDAILIGLPPLATVKTYQGLERLTSPLLKSLT